jgi:tRNA-2-methylthio-N6-dimethylallyladenosine synthase
VTSHPRDVRPSFIQGLRAFSQFCPQFQIPFQAGSNAVLKRMGRGYTREEYLETIARIREAFHDPGLFVDVIVGFPGETEEQFEETKSLIEAIVPDRAFTFQYSPRPLTRAAGWPDDVPGEEKLRRHMELEALQKRLATAKGQGFVGSVQRVLVEGPSKKDDRRLTGRTPEGRICVFPGDPGLEGSVQDVRVESASPVCLYGSLC